MYYKNQQIKSFIPHNLCEQLCGYQLIVFGPFQLSVAYKHSFVTNQFIHQRIK